MKRGTELINWRQPSFFQTTYTVSQIAAYIKGLLEVDFTLQDLWVEGEVSNSSHSTAGHVYFSLKDESARISCVMWRSQAQRLERASPRNRINSAHQRVDELLSRAQTRLRQELALRGERLGGLRARLESLSPLATLERGYALVRHRETGRLITQVGQVRAGDELGGRVSDGEFEAKVE